QAYDGIRCFHVTGVQTCALPISAGVTERHVELLDRNRWFRGLPADAISEMVGMARLRRLEDGQRLHAQGDLPDGLYGVSTGAMQIGRASCRERALRRAVEEDGTK